MSYKFKLGDEVFYKTSIHGYEKIGKIIYMPDELEIKQGNIELKIEDKAGTGYYPWVHPDNCRLVFK